MGLAFQKNSIFNIFSPCSLLIVTGLMLTLTPFHLVGANTTFQGNPELKTFINEMVSKHDFERAELTNWFKQVKQRPDIIKAISSPAEALPWYKYRPIFLTKSRIKGGVEFWGQHADTLARAEKTYGVPPEIIIAIIGVESRYGKYKGKYPVMEALATLAFNYPKRSKFFRSELEQYLLLTREEKINPLSLKGSYAGAMGGPQFISSSYRHYAVDFDNDGKRDLWNNTTDIIGSVANYFSQHGWKKGETIVARADTRQATINSGKFQSLIKSGMKPKHTLKSMQQQGIKANKKLSGDQLAALIELTTKNKPEHWLGLHNFYVITRYNHSELYAMAVYQLSSEIARLKIN